MRRCFNWLILIICTVPALAHGTSYNASTPVSPPSEMVWVGFAGLALIGIVAAFALRYGRPMSWWLAVPGALLAVAVPAYLYYCYGTWHPGLSTGPEPGLDWGESRAFFGAGWREVGDLFIWWNLWNVFWVLCGVFTVMGLDQQMTSRAVWSLAIVIIGSIILLLGQIFDIFGLSGGTHSGGYSAPMYYIMMTLFGLLLAGGIIGFRKARRKSIVIIGVLAAYLLAIFPYVASGALAHGGGGVYTIKACNWNIETLGTAVLRYALDHHDRLPAGTTMEAVYKDISPYIDVNTREARLIGCPLDNLYERTHPTFVWHAQLAGKSLKELRAMKEPATLISCKRFDFSRYNHYHLPMYTTDILAADPSAVSRGNARVELLYVKDKYQSLR